MTLLESLPLHLGKDLIPFSLPAADGKGYGHLDFGDKEILTIIFMCNHCPYVKEIIDDLIKLQSDYADKGAQLVGINANDSDEYPEDSMEAMTDWVEEKGINFPYLRDESQAVAMAYQAQCTPDIYVFDQNRKMTYHGSINGLAESFDKILDGKEVSEKQNPSIGCSIKWKN